MDVDPLESANNATESEVPAAADPRHLGSRVAITVALLATFLAICKVKDDNIVQTMQQAQADKLDNWSFYQARNIRQEIAEASVVQLTLEAGHAPAAEQAKYHEAIATYARLAEDQKKKKEQLKQKAEDAG
ncbi:MAG: DUF4337 domain-containing protein, partial [Planctomycetia bacterium]|nr:DUF4337 domain-containing protein [Planctomycetia bacterium]